MLKRRCVLAFKQESVQGVAETLAASDGAINCFNATYPAQQYNMAERPQQGTFAMLPAVSGARLMTIDFETELVGTGTSGSALPAILSALFEACGYTSSGGVLTPTEDVTAMSTITIGDYTDGKRRIMCGCAGTFSFSVRNGQRTMVKFSFTGKPAPETDVSLISPTFPTVIPPRGAASLSVNGITNLRCAEVMFDAGAEVKILETVVNDTNATGYAYGIIADRLSKATLDPEATTVAAANWESIQTTPTEFALSCVVGSTSGNTITIAAVNSSAQVMQRAYGDRDKVMTDQLSLNINEGFTLTWT